VTVLNWRHEWILLSCTFHYDVSHKGKTLPDIPQSDIMTVATYKKMVEAAEMAKNEKCVQYGTL
jgi:hypothetical protein